MPREDWIVGELAGRVDWAPGLATFRLDGEVPDFLPGQFTRVGLDFGEEEPLSRPYSLASAPGDSVELFVVRVDGGALTGPLFDAPLGTPVWVHRRAAGAFTLDAVPDAPELWLVCTGTGLAPFVSMLRAGEPFRRWERIILVQSVRFADQLAYAEELTALSAASAGRMQRVCLVSREAVNGALHGRVTDALRDGALEAASGASLRPDRAQVMLCGNPEMVDEMQVLLEQRGMLRNRRRRPGHVTVEKFW